MEPPLFTLITDGACSGNGTANARGGWAAIVVSPTGTEAVLTGGAVATTNNRMELLAVIEGLRTIPSGSDVELVTDSSYVANAIAKRWLANWQRRGWKTADKKPVANQDLWQMLIELLSVQASVVPTLVRGHAGHEANERADKLAQAAAAAATEPERLRTPTPGPAEGQLTITFD